MDQRLREYFDRIEASFCRRRGAPLLLSPIDFEKAVEWFSAGVPAEVVEAGVEAYFRRLEARKVPLRRAICLSFAEKDILKVLEERRVAAVGRAAGLPEEGPPSERIRAFLLSHASALAALDSSEEAKATVPVLCRFARQAARELRDLAESSPDRSPADLEALLVPMDREMGGLVLLESPDPMVEEWRKGARARLGELADTMAPEALAKTVDNLARQEGLSRWALPRLSLLYMDS